MPTIRPAALADMAAVCDIYNYAVRETTASFDIDEQPLAMREAWFRTRGPRHPVLVAEADGRVIGWGALSPFSDRRGYDYTVEDSIYLDPTVWGQGIGGAMLSALMQQARDIGHHTVVARVVGGHEASIRLHRAHGFVEVGLLREVGWKFGQWLDVAILQAHPSP